MLKVGYFPCTQDPPHGEAISKVLDEVVAETRAAERAGFDSCLITENHQQEDGLISNPVLLAGLVGAKTTTIKVGTCVNLAPLQHPVHIAEDCAIIDQFTKGRMILGLGIGFLKSDFDLFGVPIEQRARRSEESIEIIRKCWSEAHFSYSGRYYSLNDVLVTPKPYQKNLPIWLGAYTEAGIKRAARLADGWLADPVQGLSVVKSLAHGYRKFCAAYGKKPFVVLMRDGWLSKSMEAAARESEPLMMTHRWYFAINYYVEDENVRRARSAEEWTFELAAKDRFIAGSPENCLEQIQTWQQELRPDYLVLRLHHPGGPPHERAVENIRTFGDRIFPHL